MLDLRSLYQETILEHGKRPRNFGPLLDATHHGRGHNPLCGDQCTVHLKLDGDVITEARFEGLGCAISTASASLMTEALPGMKLADVERLSHDVRALVTGEGDEGVDRDQLGKLAIFEGVRSFPMRVKCATLAWHTLTAAIHQNDNLVTTD
ncbi:MAG: SUF system NifU family Fe-S cluster assembly protein [Deltaproteobacteria bacterium]|nr:SUF system NifU family Fe-S cluster assembly protein [Deltaproteobacteria bacterium]